MAVAPRSEWALKMWTSRPTRFMTSSVRLAILWDPRHLAGASVWRSKNPPGNRTSRTKYSQTVASVLGSKLDVVNVVIRSCKISRSNKSATGKSCRSTFWNAIWSKGSNP